LSTHDPEIAESGRLLGLDAVRPPTCAAADNTPTLLADWPSGTFVSPSDGACDGSVKAIEKWKAWLTGG
jgi:hypothetical protein